MTTKVIYSYTRTRIKKNAVDLLHLNFYPLVTFLSCKYYLYSVRVCMYLKSPQSSSDVRVYEYVLVM